MVRFLLTIACAFLFLLSVEAQQVQVFETPLENYRRGLELFDKEKYGAAQKVFDQVIDDIDDPTNEARVNAEYYAALCGIHLFNRDADYLLREFIRKYPESPLVKKAYFQLGTYHYRKRKWEKVIAWFNQISIYDLTEEEKYDYYFKLGYAYFQEDSLDQASKNFFQIKDVENPYAAPAQYYFSHINYQNSNNQTALEGFRRLEGHEQFGAIVPYYIAQILYKQEKFKELISYAPPLLENTKTKRVEEIARLIGESYYNQEEYQEAIPFFERFMERARNIEAEDRYQLAYCYYKTQQYQEAIPLLGRLGMYENELGQTAIYQLADCYLKTQDKSAARNAFLEAYKMGYDEKITEDALFSYAKLSYELKYDPYSKSVKAFKKFIEEYPNSNKVDEAYNYLTKVYLTTKNYDEALYSIEQISTLDLKLKEAYQKIAYNKAIEEFQNREYDAALSYFEKSRKYEVNKSMSTLSQYWTAEANYRLSLYSKAVVDYEKYIYEPLAILQEEFSLAHYNLGYTYFKLQNYTNATVWFRKFINRKDVTDSTLISDALLRIGDCFFVQKDYYSAIDFYSKAAEINELNPDYALFQTAVSQGVLKKTGEKESSLLALVEKYPNSDYVDDAYYQLGRLNMVKGNTEKAENYLSSVMSDFPNSQYQKRAMVSLGLLYYNQEQNDKALDVFKSIVQQYPNYQDSKEALVGIRNIFVETGRVDEYASYIEQLSFVNISQAALDSTTYEAAEIKYLEGNCEEAKAALSGYLNKFNPANFALNAHFYRAECLYGDREFNRALEDYIYVIEQGTNQFLETSLEKAAEIEYDQDRYDVALQHFSQLENIASYTSTRNKAIIGQMRCFYHMNNFASAAEYAEKTLQMEKLPEDVMVEAEFIKGLHYEEQGDFEKALTQFRLVSDTSDAEMSAEAKYRVADIYFKVDSLDLAKTKINEIVTQIPSYDYWIAKGLILLSDIFLKEGDTFQAKATLQSIVDNYEGDEMLIQIAETNLQKIIDMEQEEEQEEEEPMEVDFGEMDDEMDDLFEDMEEDEIEEEIPGESDK